MAKKTNRSTDPTLVGELEKIDFVESGNGTTIRSRWNGDKIAVNWRGNGRVVKPKQMTEAAFFGNANKLETVVWQGQEYIVGDSIYDIPGANVEVSAQGGNSRYTSDIVIMQTVLGIAENHRTKSVEATLVTSCPPGYISETKPNIVEAYRAGESGNGDGVWRITDTKGVERTIMIDRVIVVPEGALTLAAYSHDPSGKLRNITTVEGDNAFAGTVQVIDIGMGTLDLNTYVQANFQSTSTVNATNSRFGINDQILKPIYESIVQQTHSAKQWLTLGHIDRWIRQYLNGDASSLGAEPGAVVIDGRLFDLKAAIEYYSAQYATALFEEVILRSASQGVTSFFASGGGWEFAISGVQQHVNHWNKNNQNKISFFYPHLIPGKNGLRVYGMHEIPAVGVLTGMKLAMMKG